MAAPTAAADTAAPPPPPPPPAEPAAAAVAEPKVSHTPPQPDAPAPVPVPAPAAKKRKLEDAGFHASAYYKIRATVADLRLRFVQVYEATDFRKSDAAREILKEIKVVVELSKKMRLDLSATSEPVKPSEKPLAGAVKDGPTEPIPSGEKSRVLQTGQTAISPNNVNDGAPPKPDNLGSAAEKMLEETQSSEMADHPKHLDEIAQGAYVTGGSPVDWNFIVWPEDKIVYYGLTKVEFRARQAAN